MPDKYPEGPLNISQWNVSGIKPTSAVFNKDLERTVVRC